MKIERENKYTSGDKSGSKGPGKVFSQVLSDKQQTTANATPANLLPETFEAPQSVLGQRGFGPKPAFLTDPQTLNPGQNAPESAIGVSRQASRKAKSGYVADLAATLTAPVTPQNPSERFNAVRPLIVHYSRLYGLDPHLVAGLMKQESGFNPHAKSPVGAMGLMQLMPETARQMGVQNAYDPAQNVAGGCRYLRQMIDKFQGNLTLAVAAYNAGPQNVEKHGFQVPPFTETQNYVKSIVANIRSFKMSGVFS